MSLGGIQRKVPLLIMMCRKGCSKRERERDKAVFYPLASSLELYYKPLPAMCHPRVPSLEQRAAEPWRKLSLNKGLRVTWRIRVDRTGTPSQPG